MYIFFSDYFGLLGEVGREVLVFREDGAGVGGAKSLFRKARGGMDWGNMGLLLGCF